MQTLPLFPKRSVLQESLLQISLLPLLGRFLLQVLLATFLRRQDRKGQQLSLPLTLLQKLLRSLRCSADLALQA